MIDFRMQAMNHNDAGGWRMGGAITNDILKISKVFEFESSGVVIYLSYIYLIVDGKRQFIN